MGVFIGKCRYCTYLSYDKHFCFRVCRMTNIFALGFVVRQTCLLQDKPCYKCTFLTAESSMPKCHVWCGAYGFPFPFTGVLGSFLFGFLQFSLSLNAKYMQSFLLSFLLLLSLYFLKHPFSITCILKRLSKNIKTCIFIKQPKYK